MRLRPIRVKKLKKRVTPVDRAMELLTTAKHPTRDDISSAMKVLLDDDPGHLTPEFVLGLLTRFPDQALTIRMLTPHRIIAAIERVTMRKERAREYDKARGIPIKPAHPADRVRVFAPKRAHR